MAPHVAVDEDLCIGSGDCGRTAPDAFWLDESRRVSMPLEGARTTDPDLLVLAARQCPTQAIRVVADDGEVLHESG
jgi:ferredoxin